MDKKLALGSMLLVTAVLLGALGITAVWASTGHVTGFHNFNTVWGSFDFGAVDYYDNNNSSTVDLKTASLHIKYPSTCCIGVQQNVVFEDGPGYSASKTVSVDTDEYKIVSVSLGDDTYSKGAGSVVAENRTGMLGNCDGWFADCGIWFVVWEDDGEVWSDYED